MEKLNKLIKECKCGIYISINPHRDYYETVEHYFKSKSNQFDEDDDIEEIDSVIYDKMKELDTIISLHFYPRNPIGSYQIYHHDLGAAVDEALSIINEK